MIKTMKDPLIMTTQQQNQTTVSLLMLPSRINGQSQAQCHQLKRTGLVLLRCIHQVLILSKTLIQASRNFTERSFCNKMNFGILSDISSEIPNGDS